MADAPIALALLARCEAFETGVAPNLPVAWPDVGFLDADGQPTDAPDDRRYLRIQHFPNASMWSSISHGEMRQGLFQIDVCVPELTGLPEMLRLADQVKARFPKGLVMTNGGVSVKVADDPAIAPPMIASDGATVPVTIPWTARA